MPTAEPLTRRRRDAFISRSRRSVPAATAQSAASGQETAQHLGHLPDLLPSRHAPPGCARATDHPGRSSPPGSPARRTGTRRSTRTSPVAVPPAAATNSAAAGADSPGSAPAATSSTVISTSANSRWPAPSTACCGLRSGANRKLTRIVHSSGMTLDATPPVMDDGVQALVVLAAVDVHDPRVERREPVQHRRRLVNRVVPQP